MSLVPFSISGIAGSTNWKRGGFIIDFAATQFKCPTCGHIHEFTDAMLEKMNKSPDGIIGLRCKNQECKKHLRVTSGMDSSLHCWLKSEETINKKNRK